MIDEDGDIQQDLDLDFLTDFDFIRACALLIVLILSWRYYKKNKTPKESTLENLTSDKEVGTNYVVKVFEYLLIVNGVMGIFLISSSWTEISNNLPEVTNQRGWLNYTIFIWGDVIFNLIASIYLSIRLKNKLNKLTIDLIISFFYLSFALGFLNIFLLTDSHFSMYLSLRHDAAIEMYIRHAFKALFIVPWILYFKLSKKIKSTYL